MIVSSLIISLGAGKYYYDNYYGLFSVKLSEAPLKYQIIYRRLVLASNQTNRSVPLYVIEDKWSDYVINAFATSNAIYITKGYMKLLDNYPDQIAFVLGHELAHVLLGHTEYKLWDTSRYSQSELELNADTYGAMLLMKAGFDVCKANQDHLNILSMFGNSVDSDHPTNILRYYNLLDVCYHIKEAK